MIEKFEVGKSYVCNKEGGDGRYSGCDIKEGQVLTVVDVAAYNDSIKATGCTYNNNTTNKIWEVGTTLEDFNEYTPSEEDYYEGKIKFSAEYFKTSSVAEVESVDKCKCTCSNSLIQQMKILSKETGLMLQFDPCDDNVIVTDAYSDMEFKIKTQEEFEELCNTMKVIKKFAD